MISIKITHNGNYKNVEAFLTKYIKENTTCLVNENENIDLIISIEEAVKTQNYFNFTDNLYIIKLLNDIVDENYLKSICIEIFKKYNIDSLDYELPLKNIDTVSDIEDKLAVNYDKTDKAYFKDLNEPDIALHTARRAKGSLYYFTRRVFNDLYSEKYAGPSLVKAIQVCEKYPGMSVFNDKGKLIFKSTRNKITPTQNHSEHVTQHAIINTPTGTGIYVSDGGKRYHVPNGTEVLITKIHNTKTEIIVTIAGNKIKTEVNSACLI